MSKKLKQIIKSDLGKSISSGYSLFILNNVVALFLTPYMLQYISKEEYGLYILCVDFLAWVGFLEFGTNKVIESKAAHLIADENFEGLNKTFNSSFYFQLGIGLLIIPFYYILISFGIDKPAINHLNLIVSLFSISAGLSVFKSLFSSVIIASKKIHLDNRIQLLINLLNYALVLCLVPYIGVFGLAIINVFLVILMLLRSNRRVHKLFPNFSINRKYFDKEELKSLFKNGIYFSISSLATLLLLKIDSFIIGTEFNLEAVASYYVTIKLFLLVQKVFELALNNFRPHISMFFQKKQFDKIQLFYEVCLISIICLSTITVSMVILINEYFIQFWVGHSFFLGQEFSLFFGYYIITSLITLPSRIVLVSSLFEVRLLAFSRVLEGVFRIAFIYILINQSSILILPMLSVLSMYFFGILFFHFQLKKYFKIHSLIDVKTHIWLITLLLLSPFILYSFNIPVIYNIIVTISTGIIFMFYLVSNQSNFKKLASIVFKH